MALAVDWFAAAMPPAVVEEIDSLQPGLRAWIDGCGALLTGRHGRVRTRDGLAAHESLLSVISSNRNGGSLRRALSPGSVSGPKKHAPAARRPNPAAKVVKESPLDLFVVPRQPNLAQWLGHSPLYRSWPGVVCIAVRVPPCRTLIRRIALWPVVFAKLVFVKPMRWSLDRRSGDGSKIILRQS